MKLIPFCILTALAVIYGGLTLAETGMYQTWDAAQVEQHNLQQKVVYYQRVNGFIEQLLRRLAVDSQRDPALAELLVQNQIKVVVTAPDGNNQNGTTNAVPSPANPTTPQ